MKFEDQREIMVQSQLIGRGIKNQQILEAFREIPRDMFVPNDFKLHSYADFPLSIACGQTISQPYIIAFMIQCLGVEKQDRVLEIGTGSGYQTAILSRVAKEVYSVERIQELSLGAKRVLRKLEIDNVHFRVGDGTRGWEKAYPKCDEFDKIIVSAGSPSIPENLLRQLADNGKLIIPSGTQDMQSLEMITRRGDQFIKESFGNCTFVPLIGEQGW